MTREQINKLVKEGIFPETTTCRELIETHISWVIICDHYVYKIKKPVCYSFLDFSTLEKRKYFCKREVELNKRLTEDIYLDVVSISESNRSLIFGSNKGTITEYAVRMHRLNREKQMDILLCANKVTTDDIQNLAKKIATFHQRTKIINKKNILTIQQEFNDLATQADFLQKNTSAKYSDIIHNAINASDRFIKKNSELLNERLYNGYIRDCHGDLHSRNIFLLPDPQPFDCIEFNDDFRYIDILNEVAFLCMDLEAFGRKDLSDLFINYYNFFFPSMASTKERSLFVYYKCYRANIRAKVNSLRAVSASDSAERAIALLAVEKYLVLMNEYIKSSLFQQAIQ